MINYILQVVLFQVLFLAIYDFFLSKETFFTKNRWYLVSTPILSFLIPLIKIPTFQKAVSQEYMVQLPAIFLSPEKVIKRTFEATTFYESINYINIIFWVGVGVFSILFTVKLMKIFNLIRTNKAEKISIFRLIFIPNKTNAFSFFNYIFLGKEIPVSQQEKIIEHEMVHSKQKHSLDLLLFEFLKIAMWFNPMIYLYQKRITLVHEYISDEIVSKKEAKEVYINNLLSNYFQVENVAFVNQFYKTSLIKKRIVMMTKKQSKKINQLKYLLLIPVLTSMLFYSSCSENEFENGLIKNNEIAKKTNQISYFDVFGKVKKSRNDKETYLDRYIGNGIPEGIEVTYDDLNNFEREEFDVAFNRFKTNLESTENNIFKTLKIYEKVNGRKTLAFIIDYSNVKIEHKKAEQYADGSFSVLQINKTPTFPGCDETKRDLDCFFKKLENHFKNNFDVKEANNLGLSSGEKKVFVSFNIDINGKVVDVKVRAPHNAIKKETIKIINSLPKMTIGEDYGKPVKVRYTLPFSFMID